MLGIIVDLENARTAGEYVDEQVSEAIKQKAELEGYVRRLEEEYSKGKCEAGEPIREDIIRAVEDFLRKKRDER